MREVKVKERKGKGASGEGGLRDENGRVTEEERMRVEGDLREGNGREEGGFKRFEGGRR